MSRIKNSDEGDMDMVNLEQLERLVGFEYFFKDELQSKLDKEIEAVQPDSNKIVEVPQPHSNKIVSIA